MTDGIRVFAGDCTIIEGDPDTLTFAVEIAFPDLPLPPMTETRTVWVD